MRYHLIRSLVLSACLATPSLAGVVVEINGTQFTASGSNATAAVTFSAPNNQTPDITITFTSTVSTVHTVRIFDQNTIATQQNPNGDPLTGVGKILLYGSATATGRVNLLVADADQAQPPAGDIDALSTLRPGLTTLGGSLRGVTLSDGQLAHDYDLQPWSSVNTNGSTSVYDTDPVTPGFQVNTDLRGIIIPDPSLRR